MSLPWESSPVPTTGVTGRVSPHPVTASPCHPSPSGEGLFPLYKQPRLTGLKIATPVCAPVRNDEGDA